MACFACSKDKNINTVMVLLMYKEAYEKTGKIFWFFKEENSNDIKIMSDEDFTKFRAKNKKAFTDKKIEYSRIDEFRIAESDSILEDSGDK